MMSCTARPSQFTTSRSSCPIPLRNFVAFSDMIEFMLNPNENGTYLMHAIWRLSNLQNVLQLERPLFSLKPVGTRISQCDRPTWLGQLSEDFFSLPWEEFVLEHNRHHASTVDLLIQGEFGWDPEEFHYALQQWAGPFSTNWSSGHSFSMFFK